MRCCSDLTIKDDAIRSKGEPTYPTRSAINLCAPDRIVLPEPYILHDPVFPSSKTSGGKTFLSGECATRLEGQAYGQVA